MSKETRPKAGVDRERFVWIDSARGIGIFLVVYAHVFRGLFRAKLLAPTTWVLAQDSVIYAFHMPLFFLLSGLFSGRSATLSVTEFLRRRLVTILYPYIVWSVIQTLLMILASHYTNRAAALSDLVSLAWRPIDQFWFLYVLLLCNLLLLLPRPLFYAAVPVGILAYGLFGARDMLLRTGLFLPMFAAGVWLTAPRLTSILATPMRAALMAAGGAIAFALLFTLGEPASVPMAILSRYALQATGIVATLGLARLIGRRAGILATLGTASLAIYLTHVIVVAAMRALLTHAHFRNLAFLVGALTLCGLFVPLVFYRLVARRGLAPWLGLGLPPTRLAPGGDVDKPPLALAQTSADVGLRQKGL